MIASALHDVGLPVGLTGTKFVGELEGVEVGVVVGMLVGGAVRFGVWFSVGFAEGNDVGNDVGSGAGFAVGLTSLSILRIVVSFVHVGAPFNLVSTLFG